MLKIEQGKKYRTQDGRTVTIVAAVETSTANYAVGTFSQDSKHTWSLDGNFGALHPHMNLVEEVSSEHK